MEELYSELEKYNISYETGFIPARGSQPLSHYYRAWEDLTADLPAYLQKPQRIEREVGRLPHLTTDDLRTEADYQRAYVLLSFIIHAYVHGCKQHIVPVSLSEPFLTVCDQLGLKPVISYASLCTYNWTEPALDKAPFNFKTIASFTGTPDEAAFYLTPVLVERTAGPLTALLVRALVDAKDQKWPAVSAALRTSITTIKQMTADLEHQKITEPDYFYTTIRPHIAGLKNVIFERHNAKDVKVDVGGGSAVQSPTHQALDQLIGVRHKTGLMVEMRAYMPGKHRDFLNKLEQFPGLSDLAQAGSAPKDIWQGIDECKGLMRAWRDKHINIVTRYIVLPAKKVARESGVSRAAVAGTAGSSPVLFLKEVRDETHYLPPKAT